MITIPSRTGGHYATLDDTDPDGVVVTIWRRLRNADAPIAKRLDVWLIDCPFHLALDAVHDIVHPLPDEEPVTQRRRR